MKLIDCDTPSPASYDISQLINSNAVARKTALSLIGKALLEGPKHK